MIKKNKGILFLTSLIILIPMLVGLILWNQFPEQVPIHWNASGEIDGWGSKVFAVVLLPLILLAIHWFCIVVTAADPKSKDIEGKTLQLVLWICPFMALVVCFLAYVTAWGILLSVEVLMPLLLGGMFLVIGNYLPKCKQNYTIGFKVSWALEDEENWNATHRFGGKVWVIGGIITMATALFGNFWILMAILALMVILPTLYSYLYYRNHNKEKKDGN